MANELLLVNPRKRRRTTRRAAPVRRRRRTYRRRNPIGPYARTMSGMKGMKGMKGLKMYTNPRRRRRVSRAVRRTRYRSNPAQRLTFRNVMNDMIVPAATAGAGAVGIDVIYGMLPIPEQWKMGPMRHVTKGLGAIVLGQIAGMLMTRRLGNQMAMGALTVTFRDAFREMLAQAMPQIPLGYYSAGADAGYDPSLGYYVQSPALATQGGESVPAADTELGYYVQEGVGAQY